MLADIVLEVEVMPPKMVMFLQKEQYMINYHPVKRRAYVILKDTATSDDVLRAAFHVSILPRTCCYAYCTPRCPHFEIWLCDKL